MNRIRLIETRGSLATLALVTQGDHPMVGVFERALRPIGVRVAFSEARVADGAFHERIHVAAEEGRVLDRKRLQEILAVASDVLTPSSVGSAGRRVPSGATWRAPFSSWRRSA